MVGDREIAEPAQRLQGCAVAPAGAQFEGAEHRSRPQAVSAHVDARASVLHRTRGRSLRRTFEGGGWVPGETFDLVRRPVAVPGAVRGGVLVQRIGHPLPHASGLHRLLGGIQGDVDIADRTPDNGAQDLREILEGQRGRDRSTYNSGPHGAPQHAGVDSRRPRYEARSALTTNLDTFDARCHHGLT